MIAWALAVVLAAAPDASTTTVAERQVASAPLVLDLNHASAEELVQLPGIGPKRAEAIVARRKQRPFTRVTQLLEVKGIGKRTLDRLRAHVRIVPRIEEPPPSEPRT